MLVLITGGARSGKSGFAEKYAAYLGNKGYYAATCRIWDDEMKERVALHRSDRDTSGFPWETVEEPLQLASLIEGLGKPDNNNGQGQPVLLIDCLTLWLTNVLFDQEETDWDHDREAKERAAARVDREISRLIEALQAASLPVLMVTNEVGDGLVPEYPLGRLFRDLAGRMNQRIASVCDQVFLVTAGIPVELKQLAFRLPGIYGSVPKGEAE